MILFIIFLCGVLVDVVATKYIQAIGDGRTVMAPFLAALLTVVNFGIVVLVVGDLSGAWSKILSYAAGNYVGTWFVVR